MRYILDLLNKIRYDKNEDPKDYKIGYFGRVEQKNEIIPFSDIKNIEGDFMILIMKGKEINIPLHRIRIREIRKKGKLVWER